MGKKKEKIYIPCDTKEIKAAERDLLFFRKKNDVQNYIPDTDFIRKCFL